MKSGPNIVTCLFRRIGRADRLQPIGLGALALTILCIGALAPAVQDCLGQIRTADNPLVRVGEYAPDPPAGISFPGKSTGSGFAKMKSQDSAFAQTEQGCNLCHNPHGSPYPALLKDLHAR